MRKLTITGINDNWLSIEDSKREGYIVLDTGLFYGPIFTYSYVILDKKQAKRIIRRLQKWIDEEN